MTNYAIDVLRVERAAKNIDGSGVQTSRGNGTVQNRLSVNRTFCREECEG
jgi:hypothetical protein